MKIITVPVTVPSASATSQVYSNTKPQHEASDSERQSNAASRMTYHYPLVKQANIPFTPPQPVFYDAAAARMTRRPRSHDKNRGLRHFSGRVCDTLRARGTTTYNEVADILVDECFRKDGQSAFFSEEQRQLDEKNIRRRVYDALNVLEAMGVIHKDKRDIQWIGFPKCGAEPPGVSQRRKQLLDEKKATANRLEQRKQQLQDLIVRSASLKQLISRNAKAESREGKPDEGCVIPYPFMIVHTHRHTVIDCSVADDRFNGNFGLQDEVDILSRLGLSSGLCRMGEDPVNSAGCDYQSLKLCLPQFVHEFVDKLSYAAGGGKTKGPLVPKPTATIHVKTEPGLTTQQPNTATKLIYLSKIERPLPMAAPKTASSTPSVRSGGAGFSAKAGTRGEGAFTDLRQNVITIPTTMTASFSQDVAATSTNVGPRRAKRSQLQ